MNVITIEGNALGWVNMNKRNLINKQTLPKYDISESDVLIFGRGHWNYGGEWSIPNQIFPQNILAPKLKIIFSKD